MRIREMGIKTSLSHSLPGLLLVCLSLFSKKAMYLTINHTLFVVAVGLFFVKSTAYIAQISKLVIPPEALPTKVSRNPPFSAKPLPIRRSVF